MSNSQDKFVHSKRLHNQQTAINKQVEIAKQHGLVNTRGEVAEPHRFAKHHALDDSVGNPEKHHSSKNPRKDFNELTIQERRMFQELTETEK